MDFITRKSDNLEETKALYGETSGQYILHKSLLDAKDKLLTYGILRLEKMCKQEYIVIQFHRDNDSIRKIKFYYDTDRTQFRKRKVETLSTNISDLVYGQIFNLIVYDKYTIVK